MPKNSSAFLLVAVPLLALGSWMRWALPTPTRPRVIESRQLTHDGLVKTNLASDGSDLYFTELSRKDSMISKVAARGGDVSKFQASFPSVHLLDVSPAHSSLLAAENTMGPSSEHPLWIYSLRGGKPQRFGDLTGQEAIWAPDGKHVLPVKGSSLLVSDEKGGQRES